MVRRFVVAGIVVLLGLGALGYASRQLLLTALGKFLIAGEAAHSADAIVVLSGSLPDRMLEAVDLYQAGLAPRIILTREPLLPGLDVLRQRGVNLPEPHEENLMIAEQLGVPAAAISVMSSPVSSTIGEAAQVIPFLHTQGIKSILLVTSKAHARRAGLIFRQLAGERVQITVCPSPYDPFAAETWWHQRGSVRRVVTEYGKLLNYLCIDRWRHRAV